MDAPDPACEEVCAKFNAAPYYRHLGLLARSAKPGTAEVTLPFDATLTQLYGGIHGGALMSLADSAISVAVATTLAPEEAIATVELSMHFLEPAGPNDVVAEGVVTRRGRRLGFGDCLLRAGGREIARARGIWRISSKA